MQIQVGILKGTRHPPPYPGTPVHVPCKHARMHVQLRCNMIGHAWNEVGTETARSGDLAVGIQGKHEKLLVVFGVLPFSRKSS